MKEVMLNMGMCVYTYVFILMMFHNEIMRMPHGEEMICLGESSTLF